MNALQVISKLNLSPLPFEGGYFRRTYTNDLSSFVDAGQRSLCTAIYYLVTPENFSALHRVKSDELFHFYSGGAVEMIQIQAGKLVTYRMGSNVEKEQPQVLVPRGVWQGLRLLDGEWALLGTTVSPGFEYEDFELGQRDILSKEFPQYAKWIELFTRSS